MISTKTTAFLKDAQGRVLERQNIQSGNQHEFNVDKLKDGVYFVELKTSKGQSITHQFYINH
ncbi:T9SS type A sorting domain-containing protein [Emticicia sp. 17c]|uniref:T9SS type A sorting domain-containing protein n=1 Tax=Emticicia sp. 17c TaxID=3127704 RepID=UPI00301CD8AC